MTKNTKQNATKSWAQEVMDGLIEIKKLEARKKRIEEGTDAEANRIANEIKRELLASGIIENIKREILGLIKER